MWCLSEEATYRVGCWNGYGVLGPGPAISLLCGAFMINMDSRALLEVCIGMPTAGDQEVVKEIGLLRWF